MKTDKEIKDYLVNNGFNAFCFHQDNTFIFSQRVIGGSVDCAGTYAVKNGSVSFLSRDGEYPIYGDYYDKMEIPGEYRLDLEKADLYNKGALVNIQNGKCYWSNIPAPAYSKLYYEGTECIRYPWNNEDEKNKYIVILENLRLRKHPSTKGGTVSVYGYGGMEGDAGCLLEKRSVEFAGMIATIRAKTVKQDKIDGITAPWYLIVAYGYQTGEDPDAKLAWVFGGYAREIEDSEIDYYENIYKSTLENALRRAGGTVENYSSAKLPNSGF